VERFLARDLAADWREWERRIEVLRAALVGLPGVDTEPYVPAIANRAPHLSVRWMLASVPASRADIAQALRDGEPSIEVVPDFPGIHEWAANGPADALNVAVWTLQPGEIDVVARRLAEVLREAAQREDNRR